MIQAATESLPQTALAYAAKGWPVLPLHTIDDSGHCTCGKTHCQPGKHPMGQLVPRGLNDATSDEGMVASWWNAYPDANIGVLTGEASGLDVLDVDIRHGGEESLAALAKQYGSLPCTVEALTGGGGRHIFFQHVPGLRNAVRVGGYEGLDLRADGGYIVAHPSKHINGKYRWEASSHPDDVPIAPMPQWLVDLCRKPTRTERAAETSDIARLIAPYWTEGNRHDLALPLSGYLAKCGWPRPEVIEVIRLSAGDDQELEDRLRAVEDTYRRMNDGEPIEGFDGLKEILPEEFIVELERLAKRHAPRVDLFVKVSDIEPARWIVEGIAIEQGLTILYGDTGAGKTTLALQIIDALNCNRPLFGLEVFSVKALLVEQDEPPKVFRNHWSRVVSELPSLESMEVPSKHVFWRPHGNTGDFENLLDLIRAYPAELVIVDSLTSLGIPDLTSPSISHVMDRLRLINAEENCSFILLHHKNLSREILGSVMLRAKPDSIVELGREGLRFHKTRGQLRNVDGDVLPVSRSRGSILFRIPMNKRAEGLLRAGTAERDVVDTLVEEYPNTTRGSARVTVKKCNRAMS